MQMRAVVGKLAVLAALLVGLGGDARAGKRLKRAAAEEKTETQGEHGEGGEAHEHEHEVGFFVDVVAGSGFAPDLTAEGDVEPRPHAAMTVVSTVVGGSLEPARHFEIEARMPITVGTIASAEGQQRT